MKAFLLFSVPIHWFVCGHCQKDWHFNVVMTCMEQIMVSGLQSWLGPRLDPCLFAYRHHKGTDAAIDSCDCMLSCAPGSQRGEMCMLGSLLVTQTNEANLIFTDTPNSASLPRSSNLISFDGPLVHPCGRTCPTADGQFDYDTLVNMFKRERGRCKPLYNQIMGQRLLCKIMIFGADCRSFEVVSAIADHGVYVPVSAWFTCVLGDLSYHL